MEIIGRSKEKQRLEALYNSNGSEFLVIYGRRRVGKTYLVRQHFENRFAFVTTGLYKKSQEVQLTQFAMALFPVWLRMEIPSLFFVRPFEF